MCTESTALAEEVWFSFANKAISPKKSPFPRRASVFFRVPCSKGFWILNSDNVNLSRFIDVTNHRGQLVDFPLPVGPVIKKRPRGNVVILRTAEGSPRSLSVGM